MRRLTVQVTMLILLAVCLLGPALAAEYVSTDTPLPILDYQHIFSYINVSSDQPITDLDVKVNISHTYDADLIITLIAPSGDRLNLVISVGGPGDNFTDTVFDDEASVPIASGSPPYTGSYIPREALSTFDGLSTKGTWGLDVYDFAGGDTGTLNSWSLIFESPAADTEPPIVEITSVSPEVLWPPNNKLVPVTVKGNVTDAAGEVEEAWIEVDDEYGEYDGTHEVTLDQDGNFTIELNLMASRQGSDKNGRVYLISLHATDDSDNVAEPDEAVVFVPHDQRKPVPE